MQLSESQLREVSAASFASASVACAPAAVALVDWSELLEDYLDNIGVTFEWFRDEMTGGWMFGYIEALRRVGVRVVLFCVSARVTKTTHFTHAPTGADLCVLPASRAYRALRRRVLNPYADSLEAAVGMVQGRIRRAWWSTARELMPYLSTPIVALARELRRQRCDTLLVQDYEHARFDMCLLLGRLTGRRVYATFQGGDVSHRRLERALRRVAVQSADGLFVGAGSETARLREQYGLTNEKIAHVFNPLDLTEWQPGDRIASRRELGLPQGARVVVWHGRVDFRRKGLDVLLDAWQSICSERPDKDLRLVLVGTGNDAAELRASIEGKCGVVWVDEYVRDRGRLQTYLHAADLYAFPSRHEGFAVAPLEAMASGLPVVAADAPGVSDLLEGGETSGGIVVPRADATAFANALGRLIDDEDLCRALGHRARARVEKSFALEAVGARLKEVLTKESKT
ncbi:MAG TPA: glycosyltransferase family 4 protein [Pyrinomonadaceae bacterium]|nr:glycosyltransferase family 4 protein [Pyrinomonadaceae bacterium]